MLSFAGLATAAVFPYSRYLIQHMLLPAALQDLEMLNCFIEAGLFAQTLLMNGILFLLASLLTKMFFGLILKKRDELPTKMVSLRNPQNFASLIFCVAAVLLATILFFSVGEYAFEDILALVVEYAVNAVRFFILVFWTAP